MAKVKYTAQFFIARYDLNRVMDNCDLADAGKKVFCQKIELVTFSTSSKVDEKYFMKIINESKKHKYEKQFWIPAITYDNDIFIDKDIMSISSGKQFFTNKNYQFKNDK